MVRPGSAEEALVRDQPAPVNRRGRRRRSLTGWMTSALLHFFLLLVLAVMLLPIDIGELDLLRAEMSMLQSEQTPVETFTVPAEIGAREFVGAEDDTFSDLVDESVMSIADPLAVANGDASVGRQRASAGPRREEMLMSIRDPLARATGKGPDGPRGESDGETGRYAEFFGTVAEGYRFVYVLDISGSMHQGARDIYARGCRFHRARDELIRSIDQLSYDQYFYVVLFSSDTFPMFNSTSRSPQMLSATEENKDRLKGWLAGVEPVGNTDPREALRLGLQLKPCALFLLTDGRFTGGYADVFRLVRRCNTAESPIHTVAYEDASAGEQLDHLSKQTGGVYRYIAPF